MYPASCVDFIYISMYLTGDGHLKCDAVLSDRYVLAFQRNM